MREPRAIKRVAVPRSRPVISARCGVGDAYTSEPTGTSIVASPLRRCSALITSCVGFDPKPHDDTSCQNSDDAGHGDAGSLLSYLYDPTCHGPIFGVQPGSCNHAVVPEPTVDSTP